VPATGILRQAEGEICYKRKTGADLGRTRAGFEVRGSGMDSTPSKTCAQCGAIFLRASRKQSNSPSPAPRAMDLASGSGMVISLKGRAESMKRLAFVSISRARFTVKRPASRSETFIFTDVTNDDVDRRRAARLFSCFSAGCARTYSAAVDRPR
jgi:hypothetical protein